MHAMSFMIWFGKLLQTKKKNKNLDTTIMKAKYALIALLAITFYGCDDNTAGLGLGMLPGNDQNIKGKLSTFDVITESVETGNIYAKTNIGYVGKFTDEKFGTYQAGFLTQFNCPTGLTFPEVYKETKDANGKVVSATGRMVTTLDGDNDIEIITDEQGTPIGNIHTVELYLWYDNYFGDSLTACRLSVYELGGNNKQTLNKENAYYTNIVPQDFYDSQNLLGTKAYTAVDLSADRSANDYVPHVHVAFKDDKAKEVGKKILKAARVAGDNFNEQLFREAFQGIYVNSDYGDGTVLYTFQSRMNVVYKCYATDSITGIKLQKKDGSGKDSTYFSWRPFTSTREVIQANQLRNDPAIIQTLIQENNNTYLKSPAGIFTEATLPLTEIENKLEGDTLNAVKLTFTNYNQTSDKKFGMTVPSSVMLIRKKFKDSFFEKNQLSDNISSFLSSHTSSTNQYTFNNITRLVNACINDRKAAVKELEEKGNISIKNDKGEIIKTLTSIQDWETETDWNKVVLIPVLVTYDSSGSTSGQSNIIGIQHDLKPGYVRLKGGLMGQTDDKYRLKLEVISTEFGLTSNPN